jgi:hypothetical protein
MASLFKKLFGGSKKRAEKDVQDSVARLLVELTPVYQSAIQRFLSEQRMEFVRASGGTLDLSPGGIDYLADNPPPSIIATLRREDGRALQNMLKTIEALEADSSGGVRVNPTLLTILHRVLEQEIQQRGSPSLSKVSGPVCSSCGSKIDHFGFTPDDWKVTTSVSVGRRSASEGKTTAFEAMMKSVGGRCPQCGAICCAQCYGNHQQMCPHCGSRIPDFR